MERSKVSYLKANGSIWVQEFKTREEILDEIEELMEKYPHILISRQRISDE